MKLHAEHLRPGLRENLGIVDRDFIRRSHRIVVPDPFDGMQFVAVVMGEFIDVARCRGSVQEPGFQADRVDYERIAFPIGDRVPFVCQIRIRAVGPTVRRDDAEEVHVLIEEDNLAGSLVDLRRIGCQHFPRVAVRQADRGGIVMPYVAVRRLQEPGLPSRLERSPIFWVKAQDAETVGVARTHFMSEPGTGPDAGKVRLAVRRARNPGANGHRLVGTDLGPERQGHEGQTDK